MSHLEKTLRIISMRGWKNASLLVLVNKALRGEEITREDVNMTDREWNELEKEPTGE